MLLTTYYFEVHAQFVEEKKKSLFLLLIPSSSIMFALSFLLPSPSLHVTQTRGYQTGTSTPPLSMYGTYTPSF